MVLVQREHIQHLVVEHWEHRTSLRTVANHKDPVRVHIHLELEAMEEVQRRMHPERVPEPVKQQVHNLPELVPEPVKQQQVQMHNLPELATEELAMVEVELEHNLPELAAEEPAMVQAELVHKLLQLAQQEQRIQLLGKY